MKNYTRVSLVWSNSVYRHTELKEKRMKAIRRNPPVYCYDHGAFLEECPEECDLGASVCEWYYDDAPEVTLHRRSRGNLSEPD